MVDNISSRRYVKEDINIQPWSPLKIDGVQYLFKSFFSTCESSYEVILFDGTTMEIWREVVDVVKFEEKWKECNPNIEASWSVSLGHVKASLEECRVSSTIKMTVEGDGLILLLKTKLKGKIPFTWKFVCFKSEQCVLKDTLFDPMFDMLNELRRQQQKLLSIVEKKDREIEDYKDQGYSTSRSHLSTTPFNKSSFINSCMVDKEFRSNCTSTSVGTLMHCDLSQLYRNVMINKQAQKNEDTAVTRKLLTFDTATVGPADKQPDAPSWAGAVRNPASIVNDNVSETLQISNETVTNNSPTKQDEEKSRREAIRRRLEDDERKRKNKKRKINI